MNPLTLSTAFASIVGLICNFKSERRSNSENEYESFMQWLESKNHGQQIEYIRRNKELEDGLKSLLLQNHENVISKLSVISEYLISISSQIGGLKEISHSISPNTKLSNQAISVLHQLEKSGGSYFIEIENFDGLSYQIVDAKGHIVYSEKRFVKDDLETLIELDLLTSDYNSQGNRLFRITRNCVSLLSEIEKSYNQ